MLSRSNPGVDASGIFQDVEAEALKPIMAIGLLNKDLTLNMAYAEACPISAAGFILAAFDPSLAHHNGSCLADCQVDDDVVHDHAKGEENANRAWELSLPLVTCKA